MEGERVVIDAVAVDVRRSMMEPDLHSLARRMVMFHLVAPADIGPGDRQV